MTKPMTTPESMSEAEKIAAELLRIKVLFQARTLAAIIGAPMPVSQRFPTTESRGTVEL